MNHVDVENKRVKDVTDAILFDLLPAAIARVTQEIDDVPQELTWDLCQVSMSRLKSKLLLTTAALDCCSQLLFTLVHMVLVQQVAGAVLVVACLLNAPPSFLEFLLCIPWRHLGDLYPR